MDLKAGERIDFISMMRIFKQIQNKEYSVLVKGYVGNIGYVRDDDLAILTPNLDYDTDSQIEGVFMTSTFASVLIFTVLRDASEPEDFFSGNPLQTSLGLKNATIHHRLPITKEAVRLYDSEQSEINSIDWELEIITYPVAQVNPTAYQFSLGKPNVAYPSTSPRSNVNIYQNYSFISSLYAMVYTQNSSAGLYNSYFPNRYSLAAAKSFNIATSRMSDLPYLIKKDDNFYHNRDQFRGVFLKVDEQYIDLGVRDTVVVRDDTGIKVIQRMILNTNTFYFDGKYYIFINQYLNRYYEMNTFDSVTLGQEVSAEFTVELFLEGINTDYMDFSTYPAIIGDLGLIVIPDVNNPVTQVSINRMIRTITNTVWYSNFLKNKEIKKQEANYRVLFDFSTSDNFIVNIPYVNNFQNLGAYYQCQESKGTIILDNLTQTEKDSILRVFPELRKTIMIRESDIHL